jgi:hypothetical protein
MEFGRAALSSCFGFSIYRGRQNVILYYFRMIFVEDDLFLWNLQLK